MRVLKHGIKPEEYVYTTTCLNCGCEFEFTEEEASEVSPPDKCGRSNTHASENQGVVAASCPECDTDCETTWTSRKPPQVN